MVLSDVNPSFSTWQLILAVATCVYLCLFLQSVRRLHLTNSVLALACAALALGLLYSTLMISAYTGLTANTLVAHIRAHAVANSPYGVPTLSVEMTTYDQTGHISGDKTYLLLGNEWMLQGDMIKVSGLLGMVGLHSGYKLTRLEGRYDDPAQEATAKHTVFTLNGGDDGFFQTAHLLNSLVSPFIDASYGSAVFNGVGSFNIYVSQDGLWAKGV